MPAKPVEIQVVTLIGNCMKYGYCSNWTPLELAVSVRLIGAMITTEEWQVPTLGVCLG